MEKALRRFLIAEQGLVRGRKKNIHDRGAGNITSNDTRRQPLRRLAERNALRGGHVHTTTERPIIFFQ